MKQGTHSQLARYPLLAYDMYPEGRSRRIKRLTILCIALMGVVLTGLRANMSTATPAQVYAAVAVYASVIMAVVVVHRIVREVSYYRGESSYLTAGYRTDTLSHVAHTYRALRKAGVGMYSYGSHEPIHVYLAANLPRRHGAFAVRMGYEQLGGQRYVQVALFTAQSAGWYTVPAPDHQADTEIVVHIRPHRLQPRPIPLDKLDVIQESLPNPVRR